MPVYLQVSAIYMYTMFGLSIFKNEVSKFKKLTRKVSGIR